MRRTKFCCNSENAEKNLNNSSNNKVESCALQLPNNGRRGPIYRYLFLCYINLRTAIYCADLAALAGEMLAALHLLATATPTTTVSVV